MKKGSLLCFALVSLMLVVMAGCGSSTNPPATTPTTTPATTTTQSAGSSAVTISNFAFSPASLTVAVGTTVTWTNMDTTTHTVTSNTGAFDSGNFAPNATYSHTFTSAGTYAYHCTIHPSMLGTIIVQ